jgi:hypothetical protein
MWATPAEHVALPLPNDLEALGHFAARRRGRWSARFFERAVLVPPAKTSLLGGEPPGGSAESNQHGYEHGEERSDAVDGAVHHEATVVRSTPQLTDRKVK